MSTKVKGEAIKESSIPMSALNDEVKNKIENAGTVTDVKVNGTSLGQSNGVINITLADLIA